jgi:hypothetical protein
MFYTGPDSQTSVTDIVRFQIRCLPFISPDGPGSEVETLINLRMASAGMRITEVPGYERCRVHGISNLNTFRDGFRFLRVILVEARWRLSKARRLDRGSNAERTQQAKVLRH